MYAALQAWRVRAPGVRRRITQRQWARGEMLSHAVLLLSRRIRRLEVKRSVRFPRPVRHDERVLLFILDTHMRTQRDLDARRTIGKADEPSGRKYVVAIRLRRQRRVLHYGDAGMLVHIRQPGADKGGLSSRGALGGLTWSQLSAVARLSEEKCHAEADDESQRDDDVSFHATPSLFGVKDATKVSEQERPERTASHVPNAWRGFWQISSSDR
jgi:hypothetical protein